MALGTRHSALGTHPVDLLWRLAAESTALYFRALPGFEARLNAHGVLVMSAEPSPDHNLIVLDDHPEVEAQFRDACRLLRERNHPATVVLSNHAAARLSATIDEFGLEPAGMVPLMTFQPPAEHAFLDDERYVVEPIRDEATLRAAARVGGAAFGSDPDNASNRVSPLMLYANGLTRFLARRRSDGEPLSTVTTIRAGAIAGIWSMGTPPRFQGQGAGRAVLERALAHEREHGATFFYLLSSDQGRPLYERVGFREIAQAELWLLPANADRADAFDPS